MASETIFSRREARRRKILENSENRLNRITGKSISTLDSDYVFVKENGLTVEDNVPTAVSFKLEPNETCLLYKSEDITESSKSSPTSVGSKTSEPNDVNISPQPSMQHFENSPSPPCTITKNQYNPIVFILCGLLFRSLIEFDSHQLYACNMVLAFALVEMGVVTVQGLPSFDSSQFFARLLLLSGISPGKIKAFIMFSTLTSSFFKDFALFTFAFVFTHICFSWLQY